MSFAYTLLRRSVQTRMPEVAGVKWPCGLMDKALVFGTKDCRFESF